MPITYEHIRNNRFESQKIIKGRNALTTKERNECKLTAASWWVNQHAKPFPSDNDNVNPKVVAELRDLFLSKEFWNKQKVATWGKIVDTHLYYDAVESILTKLGITDEYFNIKVTTLGSFKQFKIEDAENNIKSIIGINDDKQECVSYLIPKESFSLEEAVNWVENKKGYIYKSAISGATSKELDEVLDNRVEIVIPADIVDISTVDHSAIAGVSDGDLIGVEFKLVHANTNFNKDTFLPEELQVAKGTPIYKPIDWEHTDRIIGVITESEYIVGAPEQVDTTTGELLKEKEADYLKCKGLIYAYLFPAYAKEMLNRHEKGELFYSMEVVFNEAECSTCGTRYVRKGDYCEHLKGRYSSASTTSRILHGLTFVGSGVVRKPADVEAVNISVANEQNDDTVTKEDLNMPDGKFVFENQAELDAYVDKVVNERVEKLEKESNAASLKEDLKKATTELEAKIKEIASITEELEKVKAEKQKVDDEYASYKSGIEREALIAKRVAELTEAGVKIPEDEVLKQKFVDSIAVMDDDSFDGVKAAFAGSIVKTEPQAKKEGGTIPPVDMANAGDNSGSKFPAMDAIMKKEKK